MAKLRIVVGGFLGILQGGGVSWDYVQYPLGFSLLGHDTFYIEDTRLYPIYQDAGSRWDDCSACVERLENLMNEVGLKNRWAYRDEASGRCFGLSEQEVLEICRTADVFVNISCSTWLRDEYLRIPARLLIDSDPMFTQVQYLSNQSFTPGKPALRELVDAHTHWFTFGENINGVGCKMPDCNIQWKTTRQPVCLNSWKTPTGPLFDKPLFTTVMNWSAGKTLRFENEDWGQKDIEFQKILRLPARLAGIHLGLVVNQSAGAGNFVPTGSLAENGWQVQDPASLAGMDGYRKFIQDSWGEFSVAKETYVKAATGWFSCRSACYLAAGRPVVTQDTGWSKIIPQGRGLFAFEDIDGAENALNEIMRDYQFHSRSAREIAREYFDSDKVLTCLIDVL